MAGTLQLPLVDLSSSDRAATARSIRQACLEYGFFYLTNHGIGRDVFQQVFWESKKFFSLPLDEKMRLRRNEDHRGYTPPYDENLDPSSKSKGDLKESFYIGPAKGGRSMFDVNQWPSLDTLPLWRATMVSYYDKVMTIGKQLLSLIALALNLDEQFFELIGALNSPMAFVRLLHYPVGELWDEDHDNFGASAHSDYGMITLLATDGVPGLQICREKHRWPQLWEDVPHIDGAFIVNVGDMLERWTNCLFR
ncbi:putative flavonol synthase 5 [Apostasia shenzhenica]|uniref:Putative flavonol synthase 5 n=1 Tax=Apostasia shenzhenica TaxID=1088818 RepID=A0A2I0B8L0_9ASPA|nr:putative flavonol synthase 5 [Apostasia shenzhenica]